VQAYSARGGLFGESITPRPRIACPGHAATVQALPLPVFAAPLHYAAPAQAQKRTPAPLFTGQALPLPSMSGF